MDNLIRNKMLGSSKEKIVQTKEIFLEGQLLKWENVIIPISNISLIAVSNVPVSQFPVWSAIMLLLGVILIKYLVQVGVILLLVAGIIIFRWYKIWDTIKQHKYLIMVLNSGYSYSIYCTKESFLNDVLKVLTDVLNNGIDSNVNYTINLYDCNIDNNSSVISN